MVRASVLYLSNLVSLHVDASSLLQLQTFENTTAGPMSSALTWPVS
jgi:hypothetical protein